MPILYLIPSILDADGVAHIPPIVKDVLHELEVFIVERTRSARRFIKGIIKDYSIDDATFLELNKHNMAQSFLEIGALFQSQKNVGLLSEAGCPCIADPGAQVVNIARESGYIISPLSGPSSIILGLMASGMNGQYFTFHGYLPIHDNLLIKKLIEISKFATRDKSTQIFIETPYRNIKLLQNIIRHVNPQLYLSISANVTGKQQSIKTKKISQWSVNEVGKSPVIYCLGQLQR